jgi:hypothetical protein
MKIGLMSTAILLGLAVAISAGTPMFGTSASAQSQPAAQAPAPPAKAARPMVACRADFQALCKDVPQGKGQRLQCLLANKQKTSPDCQAALSVIDQRRAARKEARVACRSDLKSFCASAGKGYAAGVGCLRENEAKLSPDCKAALAQTPPPAAPAKQ